MPLHIGTSTEKNTDSAYTNVVVKQRLRFIAVTANMFASNVYQARMLRYFNSYGVIHYKCYNAISPPAAPRQHHHANTSTCRKSFITGIRVIFFSPRLQR